MLKMKLFLVVLIFIGVSVALDTTVRYVHLALTGSPHEMVVGWYTQDETDTSVVTYGLTSGNYPFSATENSSYWKVGYGNNHFVVLTGLKPSTKYYYICGDEIEGMSQEYTFVTAPATTNQPFSVAIYGDMGIENSANTINSVVQRANNKEFDWIFHVGDISYADDHTLWFQNTWNTWFGSVEPLSSQMPYMVCPGNHEYVAYDPLLAWATKNFVVYNARFKMPNANNASKSMYYSFDYGNAHFISYSTETSFPNAPFDSSNVYSDEVGWLVDDLKKANLPENRKQRPWIIVLGHRPIYSSCKGYSENGVPINTLSPPSNSLTLQQVFEDIFLKYKVDVIFNGHVHSYERNFPTYKSKKTSGYTNPKSPFNIVVGCAGSIEGHQDNWGAVPEWSASRYSDDFGYGILSISNNTHLSWKFYRAADNGLQDQVDVIKNPV